MKKPLQTEKEQFLILSKGRLIGWGLSDVKNLLKIANKAVNEKLNLDSELTIHQAECALAREWFDLFIDKGITKEVVARLNSRIGHIQFIHVLEPSPKGLPNWRRIANADKINDPELSIAYGIAHLLSAGAFKGLKRCRRKECQKYFVGRPNKKWCSDNCGSHSRVRKMRKKNRKDEI